MSLIIKNLTKYFDDKNILDGFSYEFSDKGIYTVAGESGIGKTTLLRIIAGLDTEFTGEVVGGGKSKVSFTFQEYRLFPQLTALENVVFANFDTKDKAVFDKASNLLAKLGFSERDMALLPDSLSGGMKQRVSIARALLRPTPILLLDEPTKELDDANAKVVRQLIKAEAERRLVILVSHNYNDAAELGATVINL